MVENCDAMFAWDENMDKKIYITRCYGSEKSLENCLLRTLGTCKTVKL